MPYNCYITNVLVYFIAYRVKKQLIKAYRTIQI